MKRIVWFVVLKVLECAAVFFVGWFYWWLAGVAPTEDVPRVVNAFFFYPILTFILIVVLRALVWVVVWVIRKNLEWSHRLSGKDKL